MDQIRKLSIENLLEASESDPDGRNNGVTGRNNGEMWSRWSQLTAPFNIWDSYCSYKPVNLDKVLLDFWRLLMK